MVHITWPDVFADPTLASDHVHLWHFCIDLQEPAVETLGATLSLEERLRAERFRFATHRHRFIASRGMLRTILGRYANREPEDICLACGSSGKPWAVERSGRSELKFNLSHSGGLALLAVSRGREVGVDLERVDADIQFEQIATQFFSPREIAALGACDAQQRRELFFQLWTRKEAYNKARGVGLSQPLHDFEALLPSGISETICGEWWLCDLRLDAGYAGALAVNGKPAGLVELYLKPGSSDRIHVVLPEQ
jgi:4'-phosphopantetheinyl transferase